MRESEAGKAAQVGLPPAAVFLERTARDAMLKEVYTTPKPGLVDLEDSGAHRDMDVSTFERSADAVSPFMGLMAAEGYRWGPDFPLSGLLKRLRPIGRAAEEAMFEATRGVNTHKGIIFSMGILAAACGYQYRLSGAMDSTRALCTARSMCRGTLEAELSSIRPSGSLTHGESLYLKYGARGIRGEAADGFPSVRDTSLPLFTELTARGTEENLACLKVLLALMARAGDTNVLSRSGPEALSYMASRAGELLVLESFDERVYPALRRMNRDFIARNISPGGCADLLAVTIFLHTAGMYKED